MTNGDRLTGRIVQTNQDTVLLQTVYAATIAIDHSQVQSLHRTSPRSRPTVVGPPDATPRAVAHGARPNDRQNIAARPADKSSDPARAESAKPSAFAPGSTLSGRVNVSLSDEKGNTDKNEIDFDYQVEYRRGWHRLRSLGALEYDYDSAPAVEAETTDTTLRLKLGYQW
jgi:hypothetical protein